MRIAAIDVGTNSVHLLVADVAGDGQVIQVEKARRQVMLGSGGLGQRRIADDAFQRGLEAMRDFKEAIDSLGVVDIHAAATSAVREASNGHEFCSAVKAETGIHIRVISGADEARLIYLGAREGLDFTRGNVMVFDLGGGSTEFILCEPGRMLHAHSVPLGHIRLADRFHNSDPLSPEDRLTMRKQIRDDLVGLLRRVPKGQVGSLVGTSGTIRCLARMAAARRGETLVEHAHGLVVTRKDVDHAIQQFMVLPEAEFGTIPGMDMRRSHTLPSGAILVREVMKALGVSQLTTSEQSLRDGLLVDWLVQNRPELDLSRTERDPRRRAVLLAMRRFSVDQTHAAQVARLATQLFDATAALHELPVTDRELLNHAAHLHDIGHHIAGKGHHKHGQYLLKHIRMNGFMAREIALLANLVRYHSKSRPKSSHGEYAELTQHERRRVDVLSGILKIADALDRSHNQPVSKLSVEVLPEAIQITAWCEAGGELELWATAQRIDHLSSSLHRPVSIELVTDGKRLTR